MIQLRTDTLMRIHERHPITCPLINPLIFDGDKCTRIYETTVEHNPEYLYIDSADLRKAILDLETWSHDVVEAYNRLSNEEKERNAHLEIDLMIDDMNELLNTVFNFDEEEYQVNKIIGHWELAHKKYSELNNELSETKTELSAVEGNLDNLSDDDVEYLDVLSMKNDIAAKIRKIESSIFVIEQSFEDNIKLSFEHSANAYTTKLENLRYRNEVLRDETHALIACLVMHYKEELNLDQPIDYLNKKFATIDRLNDFNALNLGLIYNNSKYSSDEYNHENEYGKKYFMKLVDDLYKRDILTHADKCEFDQKIDPFMLKDEYFEKYGIDKSESRTPEFQKKILLDKLKTSGYEVVRFYEKLEDYMDNKNNFKTIELKDWGNDIKNNSKQKIKPF